MFKWSPELMIDNGQIDSDHKTLLTIANRVLELDNPNQQAEELKQIIRELYDYAKYHFKREEEFMQSLGCPGFNAHHEKHDQIIQDMNKYLTSAHHLGEILGNYRQLIDSWVISHIMEEDKKIRVFMEAKLKAKTLKK